MNRTSAQKIRRLEMRIAHLEREAGIFQQIKNIPKTLAKKVEILGKDMLSYFKITSKTARDNRRVAANALRDSLKARIDLAFDPNILLDDPTVEIEFGEYNTGAPELTEVFVGDHEMPIRDLPSFLSKRGYSREGKDVKGAYVSWYKDFKDVIRLLKDGEISQKDKVTFLQKIKRFSKLLYRVLKYLLDFSFSFQLISELILYSMIAGSFIAAGPAMVTATALVHFYPFVLNRLGKALVNVIEGSLRRRKTNLQEFDQLAFGKQASRYPHTARFARQLEQYC